MRASTWVILAVVLVGGSGCTTPPDWIERTLVTVDVTGTWYGTSLTTAGLGSSVASLWLVELKQEGPRVKGSVRASAGTSQYPPVNGAIEGTVAGDVFSFRQTNGNLTGKMRVSEGTMTGEIADAPGGNFAVTLRRTDSSPPPSPPKP